MRLLGAELLKATAMTLLLAAIVCGFYPVAVLALAQGFFPHQANASITYHGGVAVGSELLGQPFVGAKYFHPRPSAAGDGYDALASGGSNLGPTSETLMVKIQERVQEYRRENMLPRDAVVPADAVTASGSGLDPHISVRNAMLQARRVADARGMDANEVIDAIRKHTEGRTFGVLGEPRVNVLRLNMSLTLSSDTGR